MSVTDYVDTFDSRGDLYNHAAEINRNARDQERRYLVDLLKIQSHHLVCDAPAGGGYLAEGLVDLVESPRQITCVEPSRQFAQPIPEKFKRLLAPIHNIPCDKACFDRVGSLAGLHHLKDKQSFFDECNRILKPGGLVAFADVLADTSVARFLNGPVDQFTETGHKGLFIETGDFSTWCEASGLMHVSERTQRMSWHFDNEPQLLRYCQALFGMTKANMAQVAKALSQHFDIQWDGEGVSLPWVLTYGVAQKPLVT